MDNMLTIALVVLASSIVVFFAKEFSDFFKKVFAIPGMTLILPLLLVTALIVNFENWVYLGLAHIQTFLLSLSTKLASWMPFRLGANYVANILVLMGFSFLPVLGLQYWVKRKSYHSFPYTGLTITVLWLFFAVLLAIDPHYY
ncbi:MULTISPECIES: hypothetical protein [Legionella]|uniref:Uncharacterized protein n=1 Tax=Legionella drozanskii LLAP-1 TaxID=1212489 RepID=A0A0W0SRX5_9GAMM|nr:MULTISPECIES: hypothetical protein [Legionella]KTC86035.1 hypothetical protein Ldro_2360 [Legionella drozanskii LLAP-1]PJE10548.1 MAG: hypothetical protein CK430_09855 [Legionella sp.]